MRPTPDLTAANAAPRCKARSKRSGERCRGPAVRGKQVCRMHGAGGGAPKGNRNALKHGFYTAQAVGERQIMSALLKVKLWNMRVP